MPSPFLLRVYAESDLKQPFRFLIRAAPKDKRAKPGVTACIVTCYWADGQPRTPPLAFTYRIGKLKEPS